MMLGINLTLGERTKCAPCRFCGRRLPNWQRHPFALAPAPLGGGGFTDRDVMAFCALDPEDRRRIRAAVDSPNPPAKSFAAFGSDQPSRAWYEWHWHRGVDPDRVREPVAPWIRKRLATRDGLRCRYCGAKGVELTGDHVVPYSRGGSDDLGNLVLACRPCNSRKGARTPEEAGMQLLPVEGAR